VHCSTTGVLGTTGDRRADENTPLRPTNVYEETKAEAELAVLAACEQGFPAVVARPGLVYGPGDLHLVGFFRSVLKRQFRPIGRETVWLHPIYIDDMTEAFLRCAVCPTAIGECFHLAGPDPVSLEELAAAIAEAAGTTPARGRIPLPAARALAAVGDALPVRLRRSAPLTRSRLDFLTHSRVYSVAKAQRVLDFVPLTDLDVGIKNSVAWYREYGYLPT
jgi:nucleoside-diphosphate-sugar epimerase